MEFIYFFKDYYYSFLICYYVLIIVDNGYLFTFLFILY